VSAVFFTCRASRRRRSPRMDDSGYTPRAAWEGAYVLVAFVDPRARGAIDVRPDNAGESVAKSAFDTPDARGAGPEDDFGSEPDGFARPLNARPHPHPHPHPASVPARRRGTYESPSPAGGGRYGAVHAVRVTRQAALCSAHQRLLTGHPRRQERGPKHAPRRGARASAAQIIDDVRCSIACRCRACAPDADARGPQRGGPSAGTGGRTPRAGDEGRT
jgi:hypothetical protein